MPSHLDEPIGPILPVQGIRPLTPVGLPRQPSYGQLRTWLAFSKRLKARKAKGAASAQDSGSDDSAAPPTNHIDEYI